MDLMSLSDNILIEHIANGGMKQKASGIERKWIRLAADIQGDMRPTNKLRCDGTAARNTAKQMTPISSTTPRGMAKAGP